MSVVAYFYISNKEFEDENNSRITRTRNEIQTSQAELGISCTDSETLVRRYIESLPPIVDALRKKHRIEPSSPVYSEGKKVDEMLHTCRFLNSIAKKANLELPSPSIVEDEELNIGIAGTWVSVGQAMAAWCEEKCINDSLQKLTTSLTTANERLALASKEVGK